MSEVLDVYEENAKSLAAAPAVVDASGNDLLAYARDLDQKYRLCQMMLQSKFLPKKFDNPQAVLVCILKGQEYGFPPMRSLDLFDCIEGSATMNAAGLQALAVSNGGMFEVLEENSERVTVKATRKSNGWSETFTFTMEMARTMGLAGKHNWKRMPQYMMYARCVSTLSRRGWSDIIGGLYATEEVQDFNVEPPKGPTTNDINKLDDLKAAIQKRKDEAEVSEEEVIDAQTEETE